MQQINYRLHKKYEHKEYDLLSQDINVSNYENDLKLLSNATTVNEPKIEFSLAFDGLTKIEIYNYLGELIATILSEELKSGAYRMAIDAEKLTSGPYICRMVSGNFEKSIQFLLLK
jgi:hypothetical protein